VVSLLGRGCQSTRRLDLSQIEKDHLFTVLEEKLNYLANLEELVRKKAVKAHLRKKYVSEEETPFVKHAFLQQQD
jgi:hypothetical protein